MTLQRTCCLLFGSVLTLTLSAAPAQEEMPSAERTDGHTAHSEVVPPAPVPEDQEAATWPVKTLTLLLQLTDEEQLFT